MNRHIIPDAVAFNLRVPRPVYEAVREAAQVRRMSMNMALTEAVEQWLATTARGDHHKPAITEQEHRQLQAQHQKLQQAYEDLAEAQRRLEARRMRQERALSQMAQSLTQQMTLFTEDDNTIDKTA